MARKKPAKRARKRAATPPPPSPPAAPPPDPHVEKALAYCHDVLSGRVPANKFVRLACKRHLDDLERSRTDPTWRYEFSEAKAGRACRFLEQLPHVKGPKAGRLFELEPWQCFIVTTAFGWVRRDTKARRFRRAYIEVPRGNGKSFLSSGIALYGLAADREEGAEVYSAATTRDQAKITYGDAEAMLKKRPALAAKLGLRVTAHAITQPATNSSFKPLSREAKNQDGKNIHVAVVDELHAHPTRAVWDVLVTGAAKRPQSLIWTITTAGFDTAGICYEVRGSVVKMLEGAQMDALFGVIYTLDEAMALDTPEEACRELERLCNCPERSAPTTLEMGPPGESGERPLRLSGHPDTCAAQSRGEVTKDGRFVISADDWKDEASWIKANPNWTASIDFDAFVLDATEALQTASKENNFKTKHLNLWCNADVAWMQMGAWDKCADPNLDVDEFEKQDPCVVGLDLATTTDIVAKVRLFYRDIDVPPKSADEKPKTERHFYLFTDCYLPEAAVENSKNSQYQGWAKEGWIHATPGNVLDFDVIEDALRADSKRHHLHEVAFDPWQAQQLANNMQAEGFRMVELRPTVQNFSEPMKAWEGAVLSGRFHHDGNPAMRWMVSNVVCHRDAKDNIYPRKERPENKIDGPVAAIMALNRALLAPVKKSVYEKRGVRFI